MKLIMAVVDDSDSSKVVEELTKRNIGVTRLASTGGFLKRGNTTLLIGLEEERLEEVLGLLEKICKPRKQVVTLFPGVPGETFAPYPIEVTVGGATVFVLNVERFEKI
ncbi:MAG: cyclic-di-AMP receptor [Thermovenabulum sp.]|uniref:cyclic-di-AMP receptor n=1 Tax=Thermovenabulum sp. TaxID=3100335 RepID=UPI003C79E68C